MRETYIIIAGVSIIVAVWIMYELIKSAVQKGNKGVEYHLEKQNRLLMKLLEKQGATYDELYKVYTDSDEEFWQGLNSASPRTKIRSRVINIEKEEERNIEM